jgi:hypothetical protein
MFLSWSAQADHPRVACQIIDNPVDVAGTTCMHSCIRMALALVMISVILAPPVRADDQQLSPKNAPLTEEVRIKWMAHIIKGVIGLAAQNESPEMNHRYCVSGFTDQAAKDVAGAVAKLKREPTGEKPTDLPILIEKPSFRPSTYYDECTGGHFYFGDIGGDPLTMINLHRRKQWIVIPNWPPLNGGPDYFPLGKNHLDAPTEEAKLSYDQYAARTLSLSTNLSTAADVAPGACNADKRAITFYFVVREKPLGPSMLAGEISGAAYKTACLSVEKDTLHIDLTERLHERFRRVEH